jgi:hypothetical protein
MAEELIMLTFAPDRGMSRCNFSNGFVALMYAGKKTVAVPTTVHH